MTAAIPTLDDLLEDVRGVAVPAGKPNRFDAKRLEQREAARQIDAAARDYRKLATKPANAELRAWLKGRLKDLLDQINASQVGIRDPLAATINLATTELREIQEMLAAGEAAFTEAVALAAHHAVEHGRFPRIRAVVEVVNPDPEDEELGASSGDESLPPG